MQELINDNNDNAIETIKLIELLIKAISHDPAAMFEITALISDKSFTIIQRIPYIQLKKYIDGVKKVEDDLESACKLSDKLFSNPNTNKDNALRIFKLVTATDTEKKIEYLVCATRSMLLGQVDVTMMFRIFRAIVDSLPEDLEYLSNQIEKGGPFIGNIQIQALERTGLMISAGINAQEDIERQCYHISSLGYTVDRFVLSLNDENRCKWYNDKKTNDIRMFDAPRAADDEEVAEMMAKMFNDNKQDLVESSKIKWGVTPDREE